MNKKLLESFVAFENINLIEEALKKNKGVFFISGHITNWELTAFSYAIVCQNKLNIVTKIQSNKFINEKITEYRELCGNEMIEIGSSLRNIFEKISKNEIVCFLMDQSAQPDYSVYADFFGQKVATFSGPAKMALKYNIELIFAYGVRTDKYKYVINLDNIDYSDLNGLNDDNVKILTERINKKLEKVIRDNPSQWLWFHRRFKHIKNN